MYYYYIIRILILLIIFFCLHLIRKRKGTFNLKRTKKAVFIRIAASILITAIVFFPFEAPYIRFKSAAASVNYTTINYKHEIKTVETDKTAFCVGHRNNHFYYGAMTKYDDRYGFCCWHCHIALGFTNTLIDDGKFKGFYHVTKLINNDTNEKCYIIDFISFDLKNLEDICIYDEHNAPVEKLTFSDNRSVFGLVVDQPDESTSFIFNGQTYDLD